jgi:hypothetical protein
MATFDTGYMVNTCTYMDIGSDAKRASRPRPKLWPTWPRGLNITGYMPNTTLGGASESTLTEANYFILSFLVNSESTMCNFSKITCDQKTTLYNVYINQLFVYVEHLFDRIK